MLADVLEITLSILFGCPFRVSKIFSLDITDSVSLLCTVLWVVICAVKTISDSAYAVSALNFLQPHAKE